MQIKQELLRFLSFESQKNLLEKWETLNSPTQQLIISELNRASFFEQNAIKQALENDLNFSRNLWIKIQQLRSQYIHDIEREEEKTDFDESVLASLS
jgi:hypothetical protein